MYRILSTALFLVMAAFALPRAADAAASPHAGKILLNIESHGEAWYVDPQSGTRSFLGRPQEALERLQAKAASVSFADIEKVTLDGGGGDAAYAQSVKGRVLAPDDLIGASWYVDPTTLARRRLAAVADAWEIMRSGIPASSAVLEAIPVETPAERKAVGARIIMEVSPGALTLIDGTEVKLANISIPSTSEIRARSAERLSALIDGVSAVFEADVRDADGAGTVVRHVHAGGVYANFDLVRNGLAITAIEAPNFRYAELLTVGQLDAKRLKKGVWALDQTIISGY